ncbi:MAG: acylneuraminate cytidylyltransferase family protein [Lentisphaeria bacterium]|nr:acylneuraminate cytidylyltransferase family protein [Lentisphaeria bacterium]
MRLNIQAWIFVKGDSLNFSGKNIRLLNGKPLVAYTIEAAKKSRYIKDVFVSTDSTEIAAMAEQYGAIVPFLRPDELSNNQVPVQRAWKHAVEWNRNQNEFATMDIMVSLPMTVPLRSSAEIDEAIELYLQGNCDSVIAVSPSNRHPAYDMVFINDCGNVNLILPNDDPLARKRKSQAYEITNVVNVCSAKFAETEQNYLRNRVKAIVVPREHSIDIRSELDFRLAEILLQGDCK